MPTSCNSARQQPHRDPNDGRPARSSSSGYARRFVRDGDVPLTALHPSKQGHTTNAVPISRLEAAETALAAERATRAHAERLLQDAQVTIRTLETRLGDLGLTRDEALEKARAQEKAAEELRSALQDCEARLIAALRSGPSSSRQVTDMEPRRANGQPKGRASTREVAPPVNSTVSSASSVRAARSAKKGEKTSRASEPKPVKWWIKARPAKRTRAAS